VDEGDDGPLELGAAAGVDGDAGLVVVARAVVVLRQHLEPEVVLGLAVPLLPQEVLQLAVVGLAEQLEVRVERARIWGGAL
jgi:hypothetical protein